MNYLKNFQLILKNYLVLFSFAIFSLCASYLIRLFASSWLISSPNELELDSRPWWEVLPMDSYWVNYLFRPMASLTRPIPASQIELEDGIEMLMLIERLAVPNFWLQPVIQVDYIKVSNLTGKVKTATCVYLDTESLILLSCFVLLLQGSTSLETPWISCN